MLGFDGEMGSGGKMIMLDLYNGLGGASQPMMDHGWEVLRIENNPLLKGTPETCIMNVEDFDFKHMTSPPKSIDLIWASPPCLEFSNGYNAPKPTAKRNGEDFEADLSLMLKAKEIIDFARPKYWVIENVIGAIKDFNEHLGPPRQIVGSFALWGNFPYITVPGDFKHSKRLSDRHSKNPLRQNYKAVIPYPLADSLRRAIEEQRSILEWV